MGGASAQTSQGGMGSSMQMGGASAQTSQGQRKPSATPPTAPGSPGTAGNGVIGQQWGPFGTAAAPAGPPATTSVAGLGNSAAAASAVAPNAFGAGGLGGALGGPAVGLAAGQDGLFGITNLMANARLGMYENTSARGPSMWPQDSGQQEALSFQAGLGGAEWQPPGGDSGRPGDYSYIDAPLEDSVPRYQQF